MRFRKGSKVEVLTKNEVPTGAWRCAEIISGNSHTYSVKYGWFPITGESLASVERVPRKSIRPCPPPVNGDDNWISGDVVEVFCELCWKPAVIVKVSGGNNFSVRILGSSSELEAHRSRLRVRQSWEDGNWFLVGKGSSNLTGPQKRKRSSLGLSDQKKRVVEKGSSGVQRIIIRLPSPASEKVDEFVSPNRIDDTMSCASSVGSCSGLGNNNGLNLLSPNRLTNGCEKLEEDYLSDADSNVKGRFREEESYVSTSVELGYDFHRSELYAYQKALGALHASGPLTWDEEEKYVELMLRNILMLLRVPHGQCWRHPYLASKAIIGLVCHLFQLTKGQLPWFIPKRSLIPSCCSKFIGSCLVLLNESTFGTPGSKVFHSDDWIVDLGISDFFAPISGIQPTTDQTVVKLPSNRERRDLQMNQLQTPNRKDFVSCDKDLVLRWNP